MIDKILHPEVIRILLISGAVGTPLLAVAAWFLLRSIPRRLCILFGILGPFALGYWYLDNTILASVGFDSIFSVIIIVGIAAVLGIGVGFWAGGER